MDGRQHHEFRTLRILQHLLHHILRRMLLYLTATDGRVGVSDAGIEQSEILVDLRRGTHGGTRIPGDHLLFDSDGRGDTSYVVALGFVHSSQELTGITRQALYITPLTFGIQCVEGQR